MRPENFEISTPRLKAEYSASELQAHSLKFATRISKWRYRFRFIFMFYVVLIGIDPIPPDFQSGAST